METSPSPDLSGPDLEQGCKVPTVMSHSHTGAWQLSNADGILMFPPVSFFAHTGPGNIPRTGQPLPGWVMQS